MSLMAYLAQVADTLLNQHTQVRLFVFLTFYFDVDKIYRWRWLEDCGRGLIMSNDPIYLV